MKQSVLKGALFLSIGGFICKILGALFRIPLSEIIGAEGIGIYQMVIPIYSFALIFVTGGIVTTLSKQIAERRARAEEYNGLFRSALYYTALGGIIFSILFIFLSDYIAYLQGNSAAAVCYYGAAGAILFAAVTSAFRGYFQGHENMFPTAVSQVIEQLFKLILGLLLSYFMVPYGIEYGALGAIIGVAAGEFFSSLYLIVLAKLKNKNLRLFAAIKYIDAKNLLNMSLPLTLGGLIIPLTALIDSFLVVNILKSIGYGVGFATSLFGLQTGMINSIVNLPTSIAIAIGMSLLPTLSYEYAKSNQFIYEKLASKSAKFVWIIVLPCALGLLVLSPYILRALFPTALSSELFSRGVGLLIISSVSVIYMGMMQLFISILQSVGQIKQSVISLAIGGAIKIILTVALCFIPNLNIFGLALSSLIMYMLITFVSLIFVSRKISIRVSKKEIFIPLISSILMASIVYLISNSISYSSLMICLVSGVIGASIYIILNARLIKSLFS